MRSRLFNAIVIAGASMTGGCDSAPLAQPDANGPIDMQIEIDMALDAFRCMGICAPLDYGGVDLLQPEGDGAQVDMGMSGGGDMGLAIDQCFGYCQPFDIGLLPPDIARPTDGGDDQ